MPDFVAPGDLDDEPTDDNQPTNDDLPAVEMGDEKMPLGEGVNLMASMLQNPEAFDIANRKQVRELRNDIFELEQAVSELAHAIESLSQGQAELSDLDIEATVQLDDEALGDIFSVTEFDRGGS